MKLRFSRIDDALEALAAGRVVIVLDSEDRENEGDFLTAAANITPHTIHFLVSQGRGQLCMPVLPDIARQLDLRPMVADAAGLALPRFAIPVDHVRCHTGISPLERAFTIRAMLEPAAQPADFIRPGHIFPLIARAGGLAERTGHTEAAVDLTRLAGLAPAGVLCEICSRDGMNMAGRDELAALAAEFHLPLITIDALADHLGITLPASGAKPSSRHLADIAADRRTSWASPWCDPFAEPLSSR